MKMTDDSCDASTDHFHAFEKCSWSPARPRERLASLLLRYVGGSKNIFFSIS